MSVEVGDRYRNTSGVTLYGQFPPDAVATVRQVDPDDTDAALVGTLALQGDFNDDGTAPAAALYEDELERNWERVDG